MRKFITTLLAFACLPAFSADRFVTFQKTDSTAMVLTQSTDTIAYDANDWEGVKIAVRSLRQDLTAVTGSSCAPVLVGTVGKSSIARQYPRLSKALKGKWEKYIITSTIVPGTNRPALLILGSDKRGTIYGIYELSRQIGVSPWYWMADAPIARHDSLYISKGTFTDGEPKVKYRGIFINDEWPSFGTWCNKQFGGVNHKAYSRIFELLLRLKANYFWPAMWASRFNEDDPLSPKVADDMGIVMGTSHHEPMMRAHKEYTMRRDEVGPWDYAVNPDRLDKFFTDGLQRNKNYENIITIGMRGDGDVAMGTGNDAEMMKMNQQWQSLVLRCELLNKKLPAEMQDAFFQLAYYPAVASAGVATIYNSATIGDSLNIEHLMDLDRILTDQYNNTLAGGKWQGMMFDNHIGYTKWSIPEANRNPMTLGFKVEHSLLPNPDSRERSIPAHRYSRKSGGKDAEWIFLPDLGRGEGCMGSSNVMAQSDVTGHGAVLEYDVETDGGTSTFAIGILPTQDIYPARGLRIGVQVNDEPLQVLDARRGLVDEFQEYTPQNLAVSKVLKPLPPRSRLSLSGFVNGKQLPRRNEIFDNLRWLDTSFNLPKGRHTLKIVMIDPEVVVEQIVVNPDNSNYSYFGNQPISDHIVP